MAKLLKNNEEIKDKSGIYSIRNTENKRLYVGRAKNIHRRWQSHIRELENDKHRNTELQGDFNKYGTDAFQFDVLEFTDNINYMELVHIEFSKMWESEPLYNVPSAKDEITYSLATWAKSNDYTFEIDGTDADCLSAKGNPLRWNIIIQDAWNDKKIYVSLISPKARENEEYLTENKRIRSEFMKRHSNYKQISMDYFYEDCFSVEDVVSFIIEQIKNWFN